MGINEIILFFVKLLAGTGVFLVGVHLLTENIEQLATNRIKGLFGKTAGKKLVNVGIGTASTALIQSSGVTTVLIVGFVNIGIISLSQATAMIMGANIGTTITAQIAALSAFPITTYVEISAGIGILAAMICKKERCRQIGFIVAGFGLIFVGLSIMSDVMKENRDAIQIIFENVTNPFLLFIIGIALTALVQSSSATTSVIIAMSVAGLSIGTGQNEMLFIILGTNIGSCVTALMSSVGSSVNAKRTGLIHLMFNTLGSVIFLIILILIPSFMENTFAKWFSSSATQIAMFHTFFNVTCTVLFLPISEWFVRLSKVVIKDKQREETFTYLDERMLLSPAIAVSQLNKETTLLMDSAMGAFVTSYHAFKEKNKNAAKDTLSKVEGTQRLSNRILDFLVKTASVSNEESENILSAIHTNVGDVMRISEIADNFVKYTSRIVDEQIDFSDKAMQDIDKMVGEVSQLFELTREYVLSGNKALVTKIDMTEESIDSLRKTLIDEHIERVNRGLCRPSSSSVFINLVSNLERMGDHLSYIAHSEE